MAPLTEAALAAAPPGMQKEMVRVFGKTKLSLATEPGLQGLLLGEGPLILRCGPPPRPIRRKEKGERGSK